MRRFPLCWSLWTMTDQPKTTGHDIFLKAMTNSFQTKILKVYLAYTSSKLCDFIVLRVEHFEFKIFGANLQLLQCLVVYLYICTCTVEKICSPQIPQTPSAPASQSAKFRQKCISSSAKELTLFRYIQIYWISCCQCIKKAANLFTHQIIHHTHIVSTLKTCLQQKLNSQYLK